MSELLRVERCLGNVCFQRLWVPKGQIAQRVFVTHRHYQGVDDEKEKKRPAENIVKDIETAARQHYSYE
jgi:hypothetical protein